MILASLASITLAAMVATAPATSLGTLVHLHPHTSSDTRITLTLINQAHSFRDIKVDGHAYTIPSGQNLVVRAPIGTRIYADSRTPTLQRGDLMLEVDARLANQNIAIH